MKKLLILTAAFASLMLSSCEKSSSSSSSTSVDSSNFTDPDAVYYLSDFGEYVLPEDFDTWIIGDAEADSTDFEGLSLALSMLANSEDEDYNTRAISLEFPNLTSFPDYALLGQEYDDDYDDGALDYTDYNMSLIVSIIAPSAESIGEQAFARCLNLDTIDFPLVTEISDSAFIYCSSLTQITSAEFPLVSSLGDGVFNLCGAVTTVELPYITSIGSSAFAMCVELTSITADAVESIGDRAFMDCPKLTTLSFPLATSVGESAFYCSFALDAISLPEVVTVGKWAFAYCTGLVDNSNLDIPKAEVLRTQAFYQCTSLTSLTLPSVTDVASGAFYSCTSLESLELPAVTTIGNDALRNCGALTSLAWATDSGVALGLIDSETFGNIYASDYTDPISIDLTVGSTNSGSVDGATLTVGSFSGTFASIATI